MKTVTLILTLLLSSIFVALPVLSVEKGLVAYWGFNEGEGDTTEDLSGNGHDGKLMGDPQWTDGYFGGGLEFDQEGDEVNIPFHENLNLDTFTVTAWANVEPGSSGHRAVVSSRDEPPVSGYIFYAEPPAGNTWIFITGGGGWKWIRGPVVNAGKWDHLAGTFANGKMNFYVNGNHIGETDSEISLNTKQEFLIGAGANERATHEYLFKGKIDEVRVYDRELSEDEIASVMESDTAPVEPAGKLATTWANLKAR
ncbi:MAG: LamG domain-containing protein [Candidatus Poribacteria bacterium]|nr:LamG domain-containing protein [Candidatus Poribacteria bacterium]